MRGKPFRHRWLKLCTLAHDMLASAVAMTVAIEIVQPGFLAGSAAPHELKAIYILLFAAIAGFSSWSLGLFRGIWRYTSFGDCVDILRVTALTLMIFVPIIFVMTRAEDLPRSTTLIAGFVMLAVLAGPRVLSRALADRRIPSPFVVWGVKRRTGAVPILLVGKAIRAETFLRSLQKNHDAPYAVVGILTEEQAWHGRAMHGIGVLGASRDLETALEYLHQRRIDPQRLVIADDQIDKDGIAAYLDLAKTHGLTLGRVPRAMDLNNTHAGTQATIQSISIGDLLDRPQVVPDCEGLRRLIEDKRVLISGAGGSIGSELVRQLAELAPAKITLVENTEFNLYSIDHELEERHPEIKRAPVICDVRDRATLNRCFSDHRPDVVFHAAALKHVPMVEFNPIEGIRTNALGTKNMADACAHHGVTTMVLISTDKAVNPHNVMGASKRCAEAYCQALDAQGGQTRFVAVRFGNVLGSTGSVVPLFQRQLAAGGPITVTHPDIERFFMTIPEAVRLVLQASVLGASGAMPRGHVYVLDMGKPIKIVELARRMILLAGKEPEKDIKIVYTGLRPGEKLFEEISHTQEELAGTPVKGVMMVSPRTSDLPIIQRQFSAMAEAAKALDLGAVISLLSTIVPEFRNGDTAPTVATQARIATGTGGYGSRGGRTNGRAVLATPPVLVSHPAASNGDGLRGSSRGTERGPYAGT